MPICWLARKDARESTSGDPNIAMCVLIGHVVLRPAERSSANSIPEYEGMHGENLAQFGSLIDYLGTP